MLIGEILEELKKENVKVSDIAKTIDGISEKPLRNALKAAGYVYSNKAPKGWNYTGEEDEPLHRSIFDYVEKQSRNRNVKKSSQGINTKEKDNSQISESKTNVSESNSPVVHRTSAQSTFAPEELKALRQMLNEWTNNKAKTTKMELLHDRIKKLDSNPKNKQRRTIIINSNIGAAFDEFCKEQRFNKSDIMELAILDFIQKYS